MRRAHQNAVLCPRRVAMERLESRTVLTVAVELVADLAPNELGAAPEHLAVWNNDLYFVRGDGVHDRRWWDESPGDTSQGVPYRWNGETAEPIVSQVPSSDPRLDARPDRYFDVQQLLATPDGLYMTATIQSVNNMSSDWSRLWKYDGSSIMQVDGCVLTARDGYDEPEGICDENFLGARDLVLFQNQIYFAGTPEQWPRPYRERLLRLVRDGEVQILDDQLNDPRGFAVFRDQLVFAAHTDEMGDELWSYDGDSLHLLGDLIAGPDSSQPQEITQVGERLFFTALDASGNRRLWSYDGLSATRVDFGHQAAPTSPAELVEWQGDLYFAATSGATGRELWRYGVADAAAGLALVADIAPDSDDSAPAELTAFGSQLLFTAAATPGDRELWRYTDGNVERVADLWEGPTGSQPSELTPHGARIYFTADDGRLGRELWQYDGSTVSNALNLANGGESYLFDLRQVGNQVTVGDYLYDTEVQELVRNDRGTLLAEYQGRRFYGLQTDRGATIGIEENGTYRVVEDDTVLSAERWRGYQRAEEFAGDLYFAGPRWLKFDGQTFTIISNEPTEKLLAWNDELYGITFEHRLRRWDGQQLVTPFGTNEFHDIFAFDGQLYAVNRGILFHQLVRLGPTGRQLRVVHNFGGPDIDLYSHLGHQDFAGQLFYLERKRIFENGIGRVVVTLWRMEEDGLQEVRAFENYGSGNREPVDNYLTVFQNRLYVFAEDRLWVTDDGRELTDALAHLDLSITPVQQFGGVMVSTDDELLLRASSFATGTELWRITPAQPGDANGDGQFDSSDLVKVFQRGKYATTDEAAWGEGDWNADGVFDSADLVAAFQHGGYQRAARAIPLLAAAVDEAFRGAKGSHSKRHLGR